MIPLPLCSHCGCPLSRRANKTSLCASCVNTGDPTREEIDAECQKIRAEKINCLNRGNVELSREDYMPPVYRTPKIR